MVTGDPHRSSVPAEAEAASALQMNQCVFVVFSFELTQAE